MFDDIPEDRDSVLDRVSKSNPDAETDNSPFMNDESSTLVSFLEEALAMYTYQGGLADTLTSALSGFTSDVRFKPLRAKSYHQEVFFSRPMCRLTYHNLIRDRKLARLLTRKEGTTRYTRAALDAKSGYLQPNKYMSEIEGSAYEVNFSSTLLAKENAFIPILTNSVLKVSGAPDEVASNYVSKEGIRKEQIGWIEGDDKVYKAFDLDVTFANYHQETIHFMIDTWKRYSTMAKLGQVFPYLNLMIGKKIDYVTGIWVYDLDEDNETIKHVMQTRGYPYVSPKSSLFTVDKDDVSELRKRNATIATRFKCFGADYDDQISFLDFNLVSMQQNPTLREALAGNSNIYVYVPSTLINLFKEIAIPWVDLTESKLKWLVKQDDIKKVSDIITDINRNFK